VNREKSRPTQSSWYHGIADRGFRRTECGIPVKDRKHVSALISSIILSAAILMCIQALTLERLKLMLVRESSIGVPNLALTETLRVLAANLRPIDYLLLAAFVGILLWHVLREARHRRTSAELGQALASEGQSLLLLAVIAIAACRFYLSPGQFALGDSLCHVSRVWAVSDSFAEGRWPLWSFFNYAGYPLLQFYGPLFFVTAGAAARLIGNVEWTIKVFLFLMHCGSAFPMYSWIRSIRLSRHAALVAAVGYLLTFQHTHTIVWTGAFPVATIYFLFPCVLLAIERATARVSTKWTVILVLSTAGLILGHDGYAAHGLQLVLLYIILRWALPGEGRMAPKRALSAVLSIAAGVLLCAGFLWPVVAEGKWVYQPTEIPFLLPGLPTIEFLKKLLLWRNLASGWTVAYVGISLVGFAIAGGFLSWRRRSAEDVTQMLRASAIVAVLAVLCAARNGRVMNLAIPFIALLAGALTQVRAKGPGPRLTLALLAILLLDLGPTTIQLPFRTDRQFLRDGMRLAARAVYPHRALFADASPNGTHFSHWGYYDGTGLILPTGFFPQGAPHSLNTINAMVDALNVPEGIAASTRIDLLYLWDVAGLVAHTRDRFVEPRVEGTEIQVTGAQGNYPEIPIARVSHATPVIFSERIAVAVDDSLKELQKAEFLMDHGESDPPRRDYLRHVARWAERMSINRERCAAEVVLLESGEEKTWPPRGWESEERPLQYAQNPAVTNPHSVAPLIVAQCVTELRKVSLTYTAPEDGFLHLAYSWYPALRVLVDGTEVAPLRSVFGAIVIPTKAGSHRLELIPFETKTRRFSLIAGIAAGALCTLLALQVQQRG
jgi:hypothetical protein